MESGKVLEHIVIDAGALIKGHGLEFHKCGKVPILILSNELSLELESNINFLL